MANIEDILQDLYKLDPELKMHEDKIRGLIIKMMESKPDTKFDENFKFQLRSQILDHINQSKTYQEVSVNTGFTSIWTNLQYLVSGFALAGLAAFAGFYYYQNIYVTGQPGKDIISMSATGNTVNNASKLAFNVQISDSGSNAFGSLSGFGMGSRASGGAGTSSAESMVPSSGPQNNSFGSTSDMHGKMIATDSVLYNPVIYKYIYSGEQIDLSGLNMPVLKRNRGIGGADVFQQVLGNLQLDNFDVKKLSNLKIDNLNIFEDKDLGYNLYLNFSDGSLGIWKNYTKWPQVSYNNPEDYEKNRIKLSDLPSDQSVIDAVGVFTKQYGIDISRYGTPYVDNSWKKSYEESENKDTFYFPESLTVVYPLMIEGKSVYEEYGQAAGIRISYDIKNKKVSDVAGIESMNLSSSTYELEKNYDNLKSMIEQGGRSGTPIALYDARVGGAEMSGKIEEVQLGKPEVAYILIYEYTNNVQEKYYVPGLVFPVISNDNNSYKQTVAIPLVKEFYGK